MSTPLATISICAALRMSATSCTTPGGVRGMVLALRDTSGLFPDGLSAQWLGPDAAAFLDAHRLELVAGRCVDLEIYHIRLASNELRARIKHCQLAPLPPSWINHSEKQATTTRAHTA